jgi:hypothetical protein
MQLLLSVETHNNPTVTQSCYGFHNPTMTGSCYGFIVTWSRYGFMLPIRNEAYSGLSLSKPLDMVVILICAQSNS